jgi:hypothetical protein
LADLTKRLPRYPSVLVARVGCLAVAKAFQASNWRRALADAALRAARLKSLPLIVDVKDDAAVLLSSPWLRGIVATAVNSSVPIKRFKQTAG